MSAGKPEWQPLGSTEPELRKVQSLSLAVPELGLGKQPRGEAAELRVEVAGWGSAARICPAHCVSLKALRLPGRLSAEQVAEGSCWGLWHACGSAAPRGLFSPPS